MKSNQLLYHYCSSPTAFAILQSRTVRLSALSAANDTLEGRVLGKVFSDMISSTTLAKGVVDVASVIAEGYPEATEGFALCLSEEGDLLSQWRAYARDGTGVSIGFAPKELIVDHGAVNFGAQYFELTKVEYGEEDLRENLFPVVQALQKSFSEYGEFISLNEGITKERAIAALADRKGDIQGLFKGEESSSELLSQLLSLLAPLHFRIYSTKPRPFHEEREWRLLRYRHRVPLNEVEYFADDSSIRPYIPCLIADPAKNAVREVVLGPKHSSNINWVRAFLASAGLSHVHVRRSTISSYR